MDFQRKGFIEKDALVENLISLGIAMESNEVEMMLSLVQKKQNQKINLREFIKIFEKNTFSENCLKLIKNEAKESIIEEKIKII